MSKKKTEQPIVEKVEKKAQNKCKECKKVCKTECKKGCNVGAKDYEVVIPKINYISGDNAYVLVCGKITEVKVLDVSICLGELKGVSEDGKKLHMNVIIEYLTTHGTYSPSDLFDNPRKLADSLLENVLFLTK